MGDGKTKTVTVCTGFTDGLVVSVADRDTVLEVEVDEKAVVDEDMGFEVIIAEEMWFEAAVAEEMADKRESIETGAEDQVSKLYETLGVLLPVSVIFVLFVLFHTTGQVLGSRLFGTQEHK